MYTNRPFFLYFPFFPAPAAFLPPSAKLVVKIITFFFVTDGVDKDTTSVGLKSEHFQKCEQ